MAYPNLRGQEVFQKLVCLFLIFEIPKCRETLRLQFMPKHPKYKINISFAYKFYARTLKSFFVLLVNLFILTITQPHDVRCVWNIPFMVSHWW